MKVEVCWLYSSSRNVYFRKVGVGIVQVAGSNPRIIAPQEFLEEGKAAFQLPMITCGNLDPRLTKLEFNAVNRVRVQALVIQAINQGILDLVHFFGVLSDELGNVSIGVGYSTVGVLPAFNVNSSSLLEHIEYEFNFEFDEPGVPGLERLARYERTWVI